MSTLPELPEDIRQSIEDLRHLRRLVDQSGKNALFRQVSRSISSLFLLMGVAGIILGVGMQLIYQYAPPVVAGLPKTTALWIIGAISLVIFGGLKSFGIARAAHKEGFSLFGVIGKMLRNEYMRLLPFAAVGALGAVLLAEAGYGQYLFGYLSSMAAAMLVGFTLIVRIRSLLVLGLCILAFSIPATFLFFDYPFYKIAVCWSIPLIIFGLVENGSRNEPDEA